MIKENVSNVVVRFYPLKRVFSFIVGALFFIAGTLKLIDPVGAGLVVTEYFKFLHLGFLKVMSGPVALTMAVLECLIGAALITGVAKKLASIVAAVMTGFFTVLTLLLTIFNPHMDCGCFGEAIHLTHFQTLLKNLVLCFLLLVMLAPGNGYSGKAKPRGKASFFIIVVATGFLTLYSLLSIPFIDFTPFGIGAELAASQENESQADEQFYATFVYEKNGQEGSFTLDHLPDSTWTYVRTETYQKNGPIENENIPELAFTDADGNYHNEDIVLGNALVVSSYRPDKLKPASYKKIASVLSKASEKGFKTAFLVASDPMTMESILSDESIDQESRMALMSSIYFADYKTLITLNRSNGGATWLNEGEIISKYARLALPSRDKLEDMAKANAMEEMLTSSNRGRLWLQGYFLYTFAVMLLL